MEVHFERGRVKIVIEMDEKCCYAYHILDDEIDGDVWLFNTSPCLNDAPWKNGEEPPYQNPNKYAYDHIPRKPISEDDFRVLFNPENESFGVYFREKLVGIVGPNQRPGKSAFARIDSPVARAMTNPVPLPE